MKYLLTLLLITVSNFVISQKIRFKFDKVPKLTAALNGWLLGMGWINDQG